MFNLFLNAARTSHQWEFMWHHIEPLITTLLNEGSHISLKLAVVRASPHLPWLRFINGERLARSWAAAALVVPYTDEVGQTVVDTLLQITSDDALRPHIPVGMWTWLNKPPSLPPVCWGRRCGNRLDTIGIVRALGDIEILKSYLLLVLSEWDYHDLPGMPISIREDFCGIGMGHHRKDLLQRLNHVLGQLDLGLEHLRQHNPNLDEYDIRRTKRECEELKAVLLEVDGEANDMLTREPLGLVIPFNLLTPTDMHRMPLSVRVRTPFPVSIVARPNHPSLLPPIYNSLSLFSNRGVAAVLVESPVVFVAIVTCPSSCLFLQLCIAFGVILFCSLE